MCAGRGTRRPTPRTRVLPEGTERATSGSPGEIERGPERGDPGRRLPRFPESLVSAGPQRAPPSVLRNHRDLISESCQSCRARVPAAPGRLPRPRGCFLEQERGPEGPGRRAAGRARGGDALPAAQGAPEPGARAPHAPLSLEEDSQGHTWPRRLGRRSAPCVTHTREQPAAPQLRRGPVPSKLPRAAPFGSNPRRARAATVTQQTDSVCGERAGPVTRERSVLDA